MGKPCGGSRYFVGGLGATVIFRRAGFLLEGHHQMYRRTVANAIARGPDPPAQCANDVGTPMEADSMVSFPRLSRKTLVEQARDVPLGNAHAIIFADKPQLIAPRLVRNLGTYAQDAMALARITHCLRCIDDQVLQDQAQYRAR
jgi:hypothetical protein